MKRGDTMTLASCYVGPRSLTSPREDAMSDEEQAKTLVNHQFTKIPHVVCPGLNPPGVNKVVQLDLWCHRDHQLDQARVDSIKNLTVIKALVPESLTNEDGEAEIEMGIALFVRLDKLSDDAQTLVRRDLALPDLRTGRRS